MELQVDSPRAPTACDICDKMFSNKANMKRHRVSHSDVKTFECRICNKKFHRKDQIQEHWTTHTKPGVDFDCPVLGCEEKFSTFTHLRNHTEQGHSISAFTPATCKHCYVHYKTARRLMVHYHTRDLFSDEGLDSLEPDSADESMDVAASNEGMEMINQLFDAMPKLQPEQRKRKRKAQPVTVKIEPEMPENSFNNLLLSFVNQHCNLNLTSDDPVMPLTVNTETSLQNEVIVKNESSFQNEVMVKNESSLQNEVTASSNRSTPDSMLSGTATESSSESVDFDMNRQSTPENTEQKVIEKESSPTTPYSSIRGTSMEPPKCEEPINIGVNKRAPKIRKKAEEEKFDCKFCDISYKDVAMFMMHMGFHTRTEPFKCNMCGVSCVNRFDFNAHLMYGDHRKDKFSFN